MCYIEICTKAMDMPKITEDVISDMKNKNKSMEKSIPEQYCITKQEKNTELELSKNIDYETTVHKGLDL